MKNAPIYKRQENGRVDKDLQNNPIVTAFGDSVWLWNCTKTVLDLLIEKDITYKGLMSRDFIIKRQGAGFEDTKYFIEPADVDGGPQPMSEDDTELMKAKYDIDALISPESYEELAAKINGEPTNSGPQPTFSREATNPEQDIFSGAPPMRSSAFQK